MSCPHCPHCTQVVELSVWYMHDNHTFTRLTGDIDAIVASARRLGVESPCVMLGSARILGPDGVALRTVGSSVHTRVGLTEEDLGAWRAALLADPDAVRLLAVQEGAK